LWPLLALGLLAAGEAVASASPPPRIAVGIERPQDLALVEPPSEHTALRALAQGVREACVDPTARRARSLTAACKTLGDVPESNVCVDETTEQALTRQIECLPGELSASAIDLSRSGCETSGCFEVEARKAGASHLLVVTAAWTDAGLTLTGRLTDLSDGSVHPFQPTDFAPRFSNIWPRTEPQVLGLLKWFARTQAAATLLEVFDAERAGGKSAHSAALLPPPAPEPPATPRPLVETASPDRSWLGWTLIGAGVAAGVASGIVWHKNGELTDCTAGVPGETASCRKEFHTIGPTVALGAAALGALVVGTVVLVHEHREAGALTLFLHPTGMALAGTFR
jgi:hypothetical protein